MLNIKHLLWLLLLPTDSLLASTNYLNCPTVDRTDWGWFNCSLAQEKISDAPKYAGKIFHVDFEVQYNFNCTGHEPDLYIRSGNSMQKLKRGSSLQTLKGISGNEPLYLYDPNVTLTSELRFSPGCKIEIEAAKVTFTPSFNTLSIWQTEAFSQSRILNLLIDQYKLAKSFASFINMSIADSLSLEDKLFGESGEITSRLADFDLTWKDITTAEGQLLHKDDMPAEWKIANEVYPELWDFIVVGMKIKFDRNNLILPIDPITGLRITLSQIDVAAKNIAEIMTKKVKAQLLSEQKIAQDIIERTRKWNQVIDASLQATLNQINQLL